MKGTIEFYKEKTIEIPFRMFREKELRNMEVEFIPKGVFFNLKKPTERFGELNDAITKNMTIVNYHDFSKDKYSEKKLRKSCDEQIASNSDCVILSCFKDEKEEDIENKIQIAGEVKQLTDKSVILEISYKSEINTEGLVTSKNNFDYISIYYGVSYGHLAQFEKLIQRIVEVKLLLEKRVFCVGVPMKFAGSNVSDVRFMPCHYLICDGWVRSWKGGGGPNERKLTDYSDLRDKNYISWLDTGHKSFDKIKIVGRSVYEMFHNASQNEISEYHQLLGDEILSEIRRLSPLEVEDYSMTKFHRSFVGYIIWAYSEKMILEMFKKQKDFSHFRFEERKKIEFAIRERKRPSKIYPFIEILRILVKEENITLVPILLKKASEME